MQLPPGTVPNPCSHLSAPGHEHGTTVGLHQCDILCSCTRSLMQKNLQGTLSEMRAGNIQHSIAFNMHEEHPAMASAPVS